MMKLGIKSIPADIREDAASMLAQHIPTAIIAKIVKIRSKNYLTSDSLKSLRRTVFADNGGDSKTVAERTLDLLRKEKGCNYSYILGSMDYAKSLITIRKGSWKMPKKSSISVDLEEKFQEETMNSSNDDERTRYTNSLLRGLSVGEVISFVVSILNIIV